MNEKQSTEQIEPKPIEQEGTPQSSINLLNELLNSSETPNTSVVPNKTTKQAINEARESVNITKQPSEEIENITKNMQETIKPTENKEDNIEILPKLRPRLVKFCEGILSGKTQSKSYMDAGFKANSEGVASVKACNLLKDGNIHRYIEIRGDQERVKAEKETSVSRLWVLSKYKEVADRCSQDVKPLLDRKGNQIQIADKAGNLALAYVFDAKGTVAGLDGIARIQGYNAPVESKITNVLDTTNLTQADLDRSTAMLKALEAKRQAKSLGAVSKGDSKSGLKLIQKEQSTESEKQANAQN